MFPTVLIVDDEPMIIHSLKGLLSDEGFEILTASNGYECLKTIENESPDLVLLDIWMPGIDGIETLKEIKKIQASLPVIMISGHGNIDTAVIATKHGAFSFIEKPISIDKVIVAINNALNFRKLEEENRYLRTKMISKNAIDGFSEQIRDLNIQIAAAAPSDSGILISGENGTGKSLVARLIHQFSIRSEKPLITVNCAAIPDGMFESELFGHEKGAFQGADSKNTGKFELADGGTIFLDEIGDMSLTNQGKILQVLQDGKFNHLGGCRIYNVNVRIIAATNKNLEAEIKKGNFREDLYFRLNVIPINVPSLRERAGDIPVLTDKFTTVSAETGHFCKKSFSPDAMEALSGYPWPGNVRELKNLVERLSITVKTDTIDLDDLPAPYHNPSVTEETDDAMEVFAINTLKEAKNAFELEFIRTKLKLCNNDAAKAARVMGISRSLIHKILKNS